VKYLERWEKAVERKQKKEKNIRGKEKNMIEGKVKEKVKDRR
jgi:hypothetical protein